MKGLKKVCSIWIAASLVLMSLYTVGWAEEKWAADDPVTHEWNMADLFIARPLGIAAGILGTGVFILSLPFSIPTGGVNEAAEMFIVKPFQFSFERSFPDDDM
jgi:hypothetical protein